MVNGWCWLVVVVYLEEGSYAGYENIRYVQLRDGHKLRRVHG